MASKHIAFMLEHAYGHLMPTLGIASELLRRGHRISYATTADFAAIVARLGARAVVLTPMKTRGAILGLLTETRGGGFDASGIDQTTIQKIQQIREERTQHSLRQLEERYQHDRPDLIVHDECEDFAGRLLAERWAIPKVLFSPIPLQSGAAAYIEDRTVIVPVPGFFNGELDTIDERFHFVGFVPEGRVDDAYPWHHPSPSSTTILASPTSGLLPQTHFCRLVIGAFRDTPYCVVLSLPSFDPWSTVGAEALGELPNNFHVNTQCAHLEILPDCSLFIGQGGPGSTLEALYCGVPLLLLPPGPGHGLATRRVVELELGRQLSLADVSATTLRETAEAIMRDGAMHARLRATQALMAANSGAQPAADIIERELR